MIEAFRWYEAALRERAPEMIEEARQLADGIVDPTASDAEYCWPKIWEKPLFSGVKVKIGLEKRAALQPLMPGAWCNIGLPGSGYEVAQLGKGIKADAFSVTGGIAIRIRNEIRVAAHRMLAIQGAAAALRARAARTPQAPYADIAAMSLVERVRVVQGEGGPFWGHITALHLLTDFGLACKPDLHLVRAVRALGLAPGLQAGSVPTFSQAVALNEVVWDLAVRLHGTPTRQDLRYLDKVLMEISRQGLLNRAGFPGGHFV